MDPLSIIGSVAGVATAGLSLVTILFETLDTYRSAPKEVSTIARGIQDLSLVLDQLVDALSTGHEMHTRRLRKSALAVVKRIDDIHDEVWDLVERGGSGFGRIKWTFLLKRKMRELVSRIEAHKSTVQLLCTTLLLAMQQRRATESKKPEVAVSARRRLRRQAETIVSAAHQSLLELSRGGREDGADGDDGNHQTTTIEQQENGAALASDPAIRVSEAPSGRERQVPDTNVAEGQELSTQSLREKTEEEALFLYNVVFSQAVWSSVGVGETRSSPGGSNALVIHNPQGTDVVLAGRPFASRVVDSLLQDWTVLSDAEIEAAADRAPSGEERQGRSREGSKSTERVDDDKYRRPGSQTTTAQDQGAGQRTKVSKSGFNPFALDDEPMAARGYRRTDGEWSEHRQARKYVTPVPAPVSAPPPPKKKMMTAESTTPQQKDEGDWVREVDRGVDRRSRTYLQPKPTRSDATLKK
jgi:hypothetical protein